MAGRITDLFGADAQIVIRIGSIRKTRLGPPILVPVARIRSVGIGKREILLRFRIVCGLVRQIDFFAVLLFDFLVYVRHVNGLLFVGRRGREKHEEVVPLPGRGLGGPFRGDIDQVDVVNDDVGGMFLSPLLAKCSVEPGVISGDEVAPLENLQRLLLRLSPLREKKNLAESRCHGSGARELNEFPSRHALVSLFRHRGIPPSSRFSYSTDPNCFTSSGPSFVSTGPFPWTCTRICSTISIFASVVMSPTFILLEIAASTRRMSLPERVLGMSGTMRTAFGRAILPIMVSIVRITFSVISWALAVTPGLREM